MYAGDDVGLDISLFEEDGTTPLDIQGAVINWGISSVYDSGTPLAIKASSNPNEIEVTSPESGLIKVFLGPDDTDGLGGELYNHEVEVTSGGKTTTVLVGTVKINKTILH
jgi:hypothetical protein